MKDRISTYPNRIGLTDENGVKKYYTLSREDEPTQLGTKLNKANLLSDDTASLLGLTSSATINDYLNQVVGGGFKGFWWKKSDTDGNLLDYVCSSDFNAYPNGDYGTDGYYYELDKSVVVDKVYRWAKGTLKYNAKMSTEKDVSSTTTELFTVTNLYIYYADSYETYIDDNNVAQFRLINPTKLTTTKTSYGTDTTTVTEIAGKYVMRSYMDSGDSILWYIKPSYTTAPYFSRNTANVSLYASDFIQYSVTAETSVEDATYVTSINENAYPNGNTQDGYYYDSRETINLGGAKVASGSYVGTGTHGSSNPTTLVFDDAPQILFVSGNAYKLIMFNNGEIVAIGGTSLNYVYGSVSNDGKTFSWYSTDSSYGAYCQLNESSTTYNYLVIG